MEQRHVMVMMCVWATTICYAARFNVSVAIIPMAGEFSWSKKDQGHILAAFFYGYITTGFAGGYLASHYGGYWVLNVVVALWSIVTYFTPAAARLGLHPLILCRVLTGVCQGATFPTLYTLTGERVPLAERTRSISAIQSGCFVGSCLTILTSPLLMEYYGWEMVFLATGAAGFVWNVAWTFLVSSEIPDPDTLEAECAQAKPEAKAEASELGDGKTGVAEKALGERETLEAVESDPLKDPGKEGGAGAGPRKDEESAQTTGDQEEGAMPFSLAHAWHQLPVLSLLLSQFSHNWNIYTLLSWLPTYVSEVLGMQASHMGVVVFPYSTMAVSGVFAGWWADHFIAKGFDVALVRKVLTGIGMILPALIMPVFGAIIDAKLAIALLCVIMGLTTFNSAGALTNHLDIAPRHAGKLQALTNTVATIPGMVSVTITGFILHHFESWELVWILCSIMMTIGALPFLVFGKGRTMFV